MLKIFRFTFDKTNTNLDLFMNSGYLHFSDNLTINKLASVFGRTSATHKFYWLEALIELIDLEIITIPKGKSFQE